MVIATKRRSSFRTSSGFQAIVMCLLPMVVLGLIISPDATKKLTIPSAGPSWEYLSPERTISVQSVDWRSEERMLPLQHYHAKKRSQLRWRGNSIQESTAPIQSILENPSAYNLSKTSLYLLEQYPSLSSEQQEQLVQKIRVEQRARQPLSRDALEILYCDEHICVTNKPSGVLSVPGPRRNPSLANLVYDTLQPSNIDLDQLVVHRLDMATSGIIVYALSLQALSKLHSDFKDRRVQKTYQALIQGHYHHRGLSHATTTEGEIDVDLERDPYNPPFMRIAQPKPIIDHDGGKVGEFGSNHKFWKQAPKPSLTTWTLLCGNEYYNDQPVSRVELRPWTGRTHQLRVHCAQALGAPIVGDEIYGPNKHDDTTPLCLHAQKLCIYHPISGAPMIFEADAPF